MKQTIFIIVSIAMLGWCLAGCEDEVNRNAGLTGISFTTDTVRINVGDRIHAIAMPVPWNAGEFDFTWTSENPEIASVTSDGNVEGKDGGVTNLIASCGSVQKKLPVSVRLTTLQEMLEELDVKASWHFDNPDNMLAATLGADLEEYNVSKGGSGEPCYIADGPTANNQAVTVPRYSYFIARHGIAANGGGGKVNEYSLMIDFKVSQTGRYYTFLQTDINNQDDGEVFINGGGAIGISGGYYSASGLVEPEMWCRWIVSVKCGESWKEYLNGSLIHTAASDHDSKMNVDDRMAFDPAGVVLFGDEDGEDNDITIAAVAIWDRPLTDNEVASLGALATDPNRTTPLLSMTLSPKGPIDLLTGKTQQLTPNPVPKNATEVNFTWTSSNASVATVSSAGSVTAVGAGSATVTVKNEKGVSASVEVTVVDPVELTDISADVSPLEVKVWEAVSRAATPVPENATDVIGWTTADAAVATVSSDGIITGVAVGTTTVTVQNASGSIRKDIPVTVKPAYSNLELANFTLILNSLLSLTPAPVALDVEAKYGGISLVDGPTAGQKAIHIPKGSYFLAKHGMAANGGGSKVNEYSILMDFKLLKDGSYCFIQTNLNNTDDVDFFLRGNMEEIGIGGVYSSLSGEEKFMPDVWYRVVVTAKLGESLKYYRNGQEIFFNDGSADNAKVDSRLAFDPAGILLFADEDGEDNDIDVAGVATWNRALSAEEVAALGGF